MEGIVSELFEYILSIGLCFHWDFYYWYHITYIILEEGRIVFYCSGYLSGLGDVHIAFVIYPHLPLAH